MGDWTVIIEGTGPHHNADNPGDVDQLAKRFEKMLREGAHNVKHFSLTSSRGHEEIKPRQP